VHANDAVVAGLDDRAARRRDHPARSSSRMKIAARVLRSASAERIIQPGQQPRRRMHVALLDETRTDPPDQWMKPEQRLDEHVHGGREVVAAAHVAELVLENGVQLRGR